MRPRLARALLILGLACGGDEEAPTPPEPSTAHRAERHGGGHSTRQAAPRPAPLARVARLGSGRPGPLRPGQTLDATATLTTGAERLVLDLRDGARIELEPESVARLGEEAPAQLLLARGHVHALLPPVGNSPRPPLRIGTPAGTIEIGGSGDLWVTARPDGTAWVALVGGRAAVLTGKRDPDTGVERRLELEPGRAVVAGRDLAEPTDGPTTSDAARALGHALMEDAGEPVPAERLTAAVASLDEAIALVEAERARGARLQARHRAAVRANKAGAAEEMQALVAHGRALDAARDVLLTRFERARALTLLVSPPDGDPTAVRRPRVRAALGLN